MRESLVMPNQDGTGTEGKFLRIPSLCGALGKEKGFFLHSYWTEAIGKYFWVRSLDGGEMTDFHVRASLF